MVKLSTLKFIGCDSWDRPVFKSETGKFYCSVDTLLSGQVSPSDISDLLKRIASGKEYLYIKNSFDGEPEFSVSTDIPLTAGQIQDLFQYIVSNGTDTQSTVTPDIVKNSISYEFDCGGIDSYTIYLDKDSGLPIAASDDLVGIHWIL